MRRHPPLKSALAASGLLLSDLRLISLQDAETIKVGILHSPPGTMKASSLR